MRPTILVISCEHGSHNVPKKYVDLFKNKPLILNTPHAYDLGANHIAKHLHKTLHCECVSAKVTRLLIDVNHGLHHPHCFSKFTKKLPEKEKNTLIKTYYESFYHDLRQKIAAHIAQGQQVLHLSIYTFAPIIKGFFLNTDIGLLYNTHHHGEKEVARIMRGLIHQRTPTHTIRHNSPFLGTQDYVLKSFRSEFSEKEYLGIKLGINQQLIEDIDALNRMSHILEHALQDLLELL